jgi:hypothetical protein
VTTDPIFGAQRRPHPAGLGAVQRDPPLEDGWLAREVRLAREEIATWPQWKRDALTQIIYAPTDRQ